MLACEQERCLWRRHASQGGLNRLLNDPGAVEGRQTHDMFDAINLCLMAQTGQISSGLVIVISELLGPT